MALTLFPITDGSDFCADCGVPAILSIDIKDPHGRRPSHELPLCKHEVSTLITLLQERADTSTASLYAGSAPHEFRTEFVRAWIQTNGLAAFINILDLQEPIDRRFGEDIASLRKQMSPMTQEEYRPTRGTQCPLCRSKRAEPLGDPCDEGTFVVQRSRCEECKHTWTNFYRLAGYVRHEASRENPDDFRAITRTVVIDLP